MVMVCQKIQKIITQCTSREALPYLVLHGKWQITKSSKLCKTLFVNTPGIWKMFKGLEKKKGEF
jgi:hypothetical protein